jgi:hypothetical protein
MLSWTLLVEEKKIFSEKEFKDTRKNPAAEKLSRLLKELSVPPDIPPCFTDLINLSTSKNWNSSQTVVKMRNEIVHANRKKFQELFSVHSLASIEVQQLGLLYLEQVLLHLFNYPGIRSNLREALVNKMHKR